MKLQNVLSLFTGAGGGVLADHLLGNRRIVGYVEFDKYCQRVLAQRIEDGILHNAPIYGDIRAFISEGYAASYTGLVDIISAGFPCQPFSAAGKQLGEYDDRNMWPATLDAIRIIRPGRVELENVPGLLYGNNEQYIEIIQSDSGLKRGSSFDIDTPAYFGRVLADLSALGYDAKWKVISAAELGAPHLRDRLWIVATDASCTGLEERRDICPGNKGQVEKGDKKRTNSSRVFSGVFKEAGNWPSESRILRVNHGVANRVDRIKALGNGQVPAVAATAWRILS